MNQGHRQKWLKSTLQMGTLVRLQVVTEAPVEFVNDAMDRAFAAIQRVEDICSRFDPHSELSLLCSSVGQIVPVSEVLFHALAFAWEVAELTNGTFDPTIGRDLEALGFNRHYLTGDLVDSGNAGPQPAALTYRDVVLDADNRSVTLHQPMRIDLGAVAKGLAVDSAAKELQGFEGFVVDAGGDMFVSGTDENELAWKIGIQHPTQPDETICSLRMTDVAVCTSGGYERRSPVRPEQHHIIAPDSKKSPTELLSCTAIGPFAMMADAFSTAAFLMGAKAGLQLLEDVELEGIVVTDTLTLNMTQQIARYLDA